MKHLNSYLKTVDLSPLKEYFIEHGCLVEYSEGAVFQAEDCHVKYFGFLVKGSVRYCCNSHDGKVHIVGFAFDEAFIGEYSAFLQGEKSIISIYAAEESSVYVLTGEQLSEFININQDNALLFKRITEELYLSMRERLMSFYIKSPEERYVKLLDDAPYLFCRASLKEIASFIGITPETLSRIRKRLTLKNDGANNMSGGVTDSDCQNLNPSFMPALQLTFPII